MTTVVGAVSSSYLPLVDLWLQQSVAHMPAAPSLIAMDETAFGRLRADRRVDACRASSPAGMAGDRQSFWVRRLHEICGVARDNVETVHSDADAFWLASPMPLFSAIDADLIFTQDHGIPKNVSAAWGFTLCCGFYVLRRCAGLEPLLAGWLHRTERLRDDQIALNQMIWECRPKWREETVASAAIRLADVQVEGYGLRIAVLPYELFTRRPPYAAPGAIIAHPFFERRFFKSYLSLYRDLLDEFGRVDGWQADTARSGLGAKAPIRDIATHQLLSRQLAGPQARPAYLAHRGCLALRYGTLADAQADLEEARRRHDRSTAVMLGLAEIDIQNGRSAKARAHMLALLGHPDLEISMLREMLQLALRHGEYRTLLAMARQALQRYGTARIWRSGQAWIAKKRSKAL